jgi:hypothetical protein
MSYSTMSSDDVSSEKPTNAQHNELTRQITLQLSADQYERLFFQPNAARGDLAKRLGKALRNRIKFVDEGLTQLS